VFVRVARVNPWYLSCYEYRLRCDPRARGIAEAGWQLKFSDRSGAFSTLVAVHMVVVSIIYQTELVASRLAWS
jgi:hypothetical protein